MPATQNDLPDTAQLRDMQGKRMKLAAQIRELAGRREQWTDEERGNWKQVNADYDALMKDIDQEIRSTQEAQHVQQRLKDIESFDRQERQGRRIGLDHQERQRHNPERQRHNMEERKALCIQSWMRLANGLKLKKRHADACRLMRFNPQSKFLEIRLRTDLYNGIGAAWSTANALHVQSRFDRAWEQRNMSAVDPTVGGYFIPEGFSNAFERKLLAFGGPRQVARIVRTDGNGDWPYPTLDDTGNTGEILGEGGSIGSSVDPTTGAVVFRAYKYSSKPVLVPAELLEDSAFNLAEEMGAMLGVRIGRITAQHFTTGDGAAKPRGLMTAAIAGGHLVDDAATTLAPESIIKLPHQIDPGYRMDSDSLGYMMHDSIIAEVRVLSQSATNNFLWQPGLQAGTPDLLNGFPVIVNQSMDAAPLANGKESILFGAFDRYIIRDVGALRAFRLEERYRDNDYTGFVSFSRHDGNSINDDAFAYIAHTT